MEITKFLLPLIGMTVVIWLVYYGSVVYNLLRIKFKTGSCELAALDNMPWYIKEVFKPVQEKLLPMGFEFSHCQIVDPPFVGDGSKRWVNVYVNRIEKIYAELTIAEMLDPPVICDVAFINIFADETLLETVNYKKQTVAGDIPYTVLNDPCVNTIEEQLEAHRKTLNQSFRDKTVIAGTSERYVAFCSRNLSEYAVSLQRLGMLKEAKEGMFSMLFNPACKMAYSLINFQMKFQNRRSRLTAELRKRKQSIPDIPAEIEAERYLWNKAIISHKKAWRPAKPLLLLITLVVFAVSLKLIVSFQFVLLIIGVVFIHEFGHLATMKFFGYRDANIFFIPFLGAATAGLKEDAPSYRKVIVYLAGPLPGLIIGALLILIGIFSANIAAMNAGGVFLFINYLNLLPIMPFDGGQICNLLLFSRFPFLEVVFQVISGIVLILFGAVFNTAVFLLLAVIMFSTIPLKMAENRAVILFREKVKESGCDIPEKDMVTRAFEVIKTRAFQGLNFSQKTIVVKNLCVRVQEVPFSAAVRFGFFSLYVGTFIIPVVMLIAGYFVAGFLGVTGKGGLFPVGQLSSVQMRSIQPAAVLTDADKK